VIRLYFVSLFFFLPVYLPVFAIVWGLLRATVRPPRGALVPFVLLGGWALMPAWSFMSGIPPDATPRPLVWILAVVLSVLGLVAVGRPKPTQR
jgi:hypothetical protein